MRGIRVMAGLLTVLVGGSFTESAAQGVGANQQGSAGVAETYLYLDSLPGGPLSTVVQTQTAAGFDMKLSFSPQLMSSHFYTTWLAPTLLGQKPLKSVRFASVSATGRVLSVNEATGIAPRQIDFPMLDATRRDPLHFSVSITAPNLHPIQSTVPPSAIPHLTPMVISNFRLNFQGNSLLDASHVSKIEAISVGPRGGSPAMVGSTKSQAVGSKSFTPEIKNMTGPGGVAISNLVFYIAQAFVLPFQQWLASSPNQTRNGSITYLKPNMTPWGTLDLKGLAITKLTTETNPGQDGIRKVRVEMTVGSVQLTAAP